MDGDINWFLKRIHVEVFGFHRMVKVRFDHGETLDCFSHLLNEAEVAL